jgi:SRSO17 transposase
MTKACFQPLHSLDSDPKEPVAAAQPRPGHRPPVHGELLAQGEVLESELAMAAAEERAESKQVEQRADHGGQCRRIRAERSTCGPPDGVLAKDTLPESWARDPRRRRAAGVPEDLEFQPKWQIALAQIRALQADGLPLVPVVADAGYGDTTEFREALTTAGIPYVVGVKGDTTVWRPGQAPLPPKVGRGGRGRPSIRVRRTPRHRPVSLKILAAELPAAAWHAVTWREGTRGAMRSRFARVRVRPAHRDQHRSEPRPEEGLLIEWPRGEPEPTKYWLATLPETVPIPELVRLAKLRWRIERDSQELKDELGLDHFEGRGWRGFHHHGALCTAAYAFLAAERARVSPPAPLAFLRPARLPKGFTPRGAPGAA